MKMHYIMRLVTIFHKRLNLFVVASGLELLYPECYLPINLGTYLFMNKITGYNTKSVKATMIQAHAVV